jgi:hypothetical protein
MAVRWLEAWQANHAAPIPHGAHGVSLHLRYRPPLSTRSGGARAPRIPRLIFQTASNATRSWEQYGDWMRSWWELNPDHGYHLFNDDDAWDFVMRHCSRTERAAYARSLVGAQRADLFRIYFLRELGGIYADTDTQLRQPLAAAIPPRASALLYPRMEFDFLMYEPQHPLLRHVADAITQGVHAAADRFQESDKRQRHSGSCTGAHSCITSVTGPYAYRPALHAAARMHGCKGPRLTERGCHSSPVEAMQRIQFCRDDGQWYCGIARHWDCRNSLKVRACGRHHYTYESHKTSFFNVTIGRELR